MKLSWKAWLCAGLVAPAAALGCRSTQDGGCSTCGGGAHPVTAHAATSPVAPAPVVAMPTPYASVRPVPVVRSPMVRMPEVNHEMTAPPAAPAPAARSLAQSYPAARPDTPAAPAPYAAAGYYHSADYTTLVGELFYNPRQDTWRLRFAAVHEEDRYGGSVTLVNVGREMVGLKTGQYVRVDGKVLNPASREVSPAYQVRDLLPAGPRP